MLNNLSRFRVSPDEPSFRDLFPELSDARGNTANTPLTIVTLIGLILVLGAPPKSTAQIMRRIGKVSPDLKSLVVKDPKAVVDVVVQFAETPRPEEVEKINKSAIGHRPRRVNLGSHHGLLYSLPVSAIAELEANPHIAYISPDRPLHSLADNADWTVGAQLALSQGFDGAGVGIAIIDSGIRQSDADLNTDGKKGNATSRVVYSQSFVKGVADGSDQFGHGTHVAGIAAGNGANSTGDKYFRTFRGIAPNANLINLRVLDQSGAGTDSSVIEAIDTAIQLKDRYNIRIINLSLGRPVFESYSLDPLCQAVEKAWQAGIVVVVAAGNQGRDNSIATQGYATITAPGNDPSVITVGAMKTMGTPTQADDLIASYSSKGPSLIDHVVKPDIVAPGNQIVSLAVSRGVDSASFGTANLLPDSAYKNSTNHGYSADYYILSGTSMATPVVSGAAALMLQLDPSLSPDTVKARLMKSASKSFPTYSTAVDPVTGATYDSQYDIFTVGAGYLDIMAALNNNERIPSESAALSPTAVYDAATNTVSLAGNTQAGTAAVWGSSNVWGVAAVWGSSVFLNASAAVWGSDTRLWGTAAVWGSSTVQDSAAVWGSAAIWGSAAVWGSSSNANEGQRVAVYGEN